MIKHICITTIIILLVTTSCKTNKITNDTLVGEWISTGKEGFSFSFDLHRCYYLYAAGNFAVYKIIDSQLIIFDTIKSQKKSQTKELKFKISKLNDETIELIADKATLSRHFDDRMDTIKLRKVNPRFKTDFDRIEFESSECFGSCPSLKLIINRNGQISYEGRAYTEKNGYYSGNLIKSQMDGIKRKINLINLNQLKNKYAAMWTDDVTYHITIQTKESMYKTEIYGFDKEPMELRILIHELMELYKHTEMRKDSMHQQYYEFFDEIER
jgi:Domain of unknown function (DUF6438)